MELTNVTCVEYSMAPQVYKYVNTHDHEISVWKLSSRLIHLSEPHLGGINGDVKSISLKLASIYPKHAHSRVVMFHTVAEERGTLGSVPYMYLVPT